MSHIPRRLATLSLVLLILVTLFSYGRVPEYLKAGVPASGPKPPPVSDNLTYRAAAMAIRVDTAFFAQEPQPLSRNSHHPTLPSGGVGTVAANGRAQLLTSREAGPYRIDVSSLPGQPVVNNTHLSILVWSLEREQPITRAAVNVSATGPAGSSALGPIPARNDVSPQFFETDLPFDMEGEWQVSIEVVAEPGEESIVVPVLVRRGGQFNLFFLTAVGLAVITLSVWTVRRVRRGRAGATR